MEGAFPCQLLAFVRLHFYRTRYFTVISPDDLRRINFVTGHGLFWRLAFLDFIEDSRFWILLKTRVFWFYWRLAFLILLKTRVFDFIEDSRFWIFFSRRRFWIFFSRRRFWIFFTTALSFIEDCLFDFVTKSDFPIFRPLIKSNCGNLLDIFRFGDRF